MSAPDAIRELVRRFEEHREAYQYGRYNETQLRREFLDPFFEALGWDVNNRQSHAEAYKEVIHEDAVKVGGLTKAPDYSFRIGGMRKFFVEAKKPSISIKNDPGPAFQLRRYAWSAKLPLSILTDFDEFAVYDCRRRPDKTDKASLGRVIYLTCAEFDDRWEEIAGIFAKESILKGSFDRFATAGAGAKRGTAGVDAAFLAEIEGWRDLLARSIALRNPDLSVEELNFAVQRTIDRIIFLRICEDRGIEDYGCLLALVNGENVYGRLRELYRRADARYNSGLFHFRSEKDRAEHPDTLTPRLAIDDKPLKEIIRGLYYPDSPYEFSVLPADILGQVYEQFLGKVIRLTAGHRAVVEEKPEVKKAGGVYYTPTYIVDYIVKSTVGKLLEGKAPKAAADLRVLDPACGSGSFLIGAYQHLLDWHRDWYATHHPEKWAAGKQPTIHASAIKGEDHGGGTGNWRLTTTERKRILLNNIYGVDIDSQAVEVTKLSLLLKVLEGENEGTLARQLRMFHERALPDLGNNIKCGNSLIGPDWNDGKQMDLLSGVDQARVNAFDWPAEFPAIMKGGGFDAVIGNPPYVRMEGFKELKSYLREHYESHDERSDLYAYFVERSHQLLRRGGRFGMIVSNKFLRANYGAPLREYLRKSAAIERVTDFAGLPVFVGATVRTVVLLTRNGLSPTVGISYSPPPSVEEFQALVGKTRSVEEMIAFSTYPISPEALDGAVWSFRESRDDALLERLQRGSVRLTEYCDGLICRGVVSGLTEAFIIDEPTRTAIIAKNRRAAEILKPVLNGRDIRRYAISPPDSYLIYTHHGIDPTPYPAIVEHLRPWKAQLEKRATKQAWYELQQPQLKFARFMEGPKIIFPDIATAPRFAPDDRGFYGTNTTYFIPKPDRYLLGLLNSSLGNFYFKTVCAGLEGKMEIYLRFFGQYLEGFPVRVVDAADSLQRSRHNQVVSLVERMLNLHKKLPAARTDQEKTALQRQIADTDQRIDHLVYDLYSLTEEEIKIVEGSA